MLFRRIQLLEVILLTSVFLLKYCYFVVQTQSVYCVASWTVQHKESQSKLPQGESSCHRNSSKGYIWEDLFHLGSWARFCLIIGQTKGPFLLSSSTYSPTVSNSIINCHPATCLDFSLVWCHQLICHHWSESGWRQPSCYHMGHLRILALRVLTITSHKLFLVIGWFILTAVP
jgi:hypothetical protein